MATIQGDNQDNLLRGTDVNLPDNYKYYYRDNFYGYYYNGSDNISGGSGNDTLYGGSGHDRLYGDSGNDRLYGESGNDYLYGGSGNDTLKGGSGNDTLKGGLGADKFVLSDGPVYYVGIDTITDFNYAEGDKILISKSGFGGASSTSQFSYNNSTGALSFKGKHFATLQSGLGAGFIPSLDIELV